MTRACHSPVRAATGDAFTDEEIDDILARLLRKAQRKGEAFDRAAVEEAAAELTREEVLGRLTERRLRLASQRVSERFDRFVEAMGDVVGDEADRLRAYNVGSEKQGLGASFSVDAEARARTVALWGEVERGLREAGLLNRVSGFMVDEDFERAVAREISRLNGGDVAPTGDGDALKVAEILNAAQERGRLMQNDAGAWIGRLNGYVTRQMHDRLRVAGGFWGMEKNNPARRGRAFREWRDTIRPLLDDRTFEGIEARDVNASGDDAARQLQANGVIDNADDVREVFLYRVWWDIVTGKSEALGGADDIGDFRPPASLARSASKSRVLHFTSPDAWMDYHQRYGRGSLLANVTAGLERAARNTALMNRWGPSPEAMFENKRSQLLASARSRADVKAARKVTAKQRRAEFDEVAGMANVPDNLRFAIIGRTIRLTQSLAKLGGMVLSGLSDTSLAATAMKRAGGTWLRGYGAAFAGVSRLQSAEGKAAADLLDVGARSAAAHLTGRFHAADGPLGWAASAQRFFYRVNLFEFWQDGLRRGVAEMLAAHLGAEARSPWGALNAGTRETLERYGIAAEDWELARLGLIQPEAPGTAPRSLRDTWAETGRITADVSEPEDRRYWTFEAIDGIPDRDLLRRAGLTGADATPETARRLREDLRIRFQGMVQGVLDDAMTEARARERSGLTRGTRPGTVWGEAVRAFTQFWSFSAAILSRHVAPAVRGYAGQHPTALLAHLILASTAMGYLSLEAKQVTKGREPRLMGVMDDPGKWDELFIASLLQGGGMGIYGDWLFGEANRNGLGFTIGAMGGPAVSELERLTTIVNKAVSGDPEKVDDIPNDLINAAKANTPFLNLFYARTALDYLIFWRLQEAVNPGSVERYEKRIERETGSDFYISPSESVR